MQETDNTFADCAEEFTGFTEEPAEETFLFLAFISGAITAGNDCYTTVKGGRGRAVYGFILLLAAQTLENGETDRNRVSLIVVLVGHRHLDFPVMI